MACAPTSPSSSPRAQCARIGRWLGPRPHYGPEVPTDALQIQRLIAALGPYHAARTRLPPHQLAAYSARFLDGLQGNRPSDVAQAAARVKLIFRIAARSEFP